MKGENFGKFSELQVIRQNFLAQNFLLCLVRNMHEAVWMALLKHLVVKTRKQSLPDPNGELSPSSGIFANTYVGKTGNRIKRLGLVTLIVARGPYANLSPAQKFERKLLQ